ncbi:MAG: hypothetical protein OHK0026_04090 [Rhodocyclaceae bacterium]
MMRALILMYHIVAPPRSEQERRFCCPPVEFARQMAFLARSEYTPLSMDALLECLDGRASAPKNPVHVSFDDGFADNLEHALPSLQRHGIPATVFALSGRLGETNDWMQARGFPRRSLVSAAQVREMRAAGITIGSHTRTHPRLTEVSGSAAAAEITDSKSELESVLGDRVDYFAYPYGLYTDGILALVQGAGYRAACSTLSGFNRPAQDRYLLRRLDIFGTDKLWQFRQKLRFGTNEATHLKPLAYYAGRIASRVGLQ